jgi:hypothetical protein
VLNFPAEIRPIAARSLGALAGAPLMSASTTVGDDAEKLKRPAMRMNAAPKRPKKGFMINIKPSFTQKRRRRKAPAFQGVFMGV